MTDLPQTHSSADFNRGLEYWSNRLAWWLSNHWLAAVNTFFFSYVGLPFVAPLLLANGYPGAANFIYQLYNFTCHQLPSRAYFIAGEQVCMCHRCVAIYATLFVGGLIFSLVRHRLKPLSFKTYLFFLLPMGLDGGLAFISELNRVIPLGLIWLVFLTIAGLVGLFLYKQKQLTWHAYLIFGLGVAGLIYVQFFGPHLSGYYLRTVTGFIFGVGTVWFVYPMMAESFQEIKEESRTKLA